MKFISNSNSLKEIGLVFCFLWLATSTLAQDVSHYTQYMHNGLAINPAYAGSEGTLSASVLNRMQWTGIEGAPNTQTLSAHAPFAKENFGVGMLLANDKIGAHQNVSLAFSYAYHIKFSKFSKLSFGLQGGLNYRNTDYSRIQETFGEIDPSFDDANYSSFSPAFGAGVFYKSDKLELGLSAPKLGMLNRDSNPITSSSAHYFFQAGYFIDLRYNWKLKPHVLVKYADGAPISYDLNTNLILNEVLWFGVSYRSFESLDLLTQLQLTPQFRFGYAYDFVLSDASALKTGSHEIMISYLFKFSKANVASPR